MVTHSTKIDDWHEWHGEYDAPGSELAGRLAAVRAHVARVVADAPAGPVTVISVCGGEGRDIAGALDGHPRRDDVRGRLVELDPDNAAAARRSIAAIGLDRFEVVTGDASTSDAYAGLDPAELVIVSGLFGHIDGDDQVRLISFLRQLCRPGGSVVWTYTALGVEGRVAKLRECFVDQGFEEVAFEAIPGEQLALTVALSTFPGPAETFVPGAKVFTFGSSHRKRA
jgi:predicted RNA methylase